MMIVGIVVVFRSVRSFPAVLVHFQSHMHVRVKEKNEVSSQSNRAAQTQPNRFVFSRSHNCFTRTALIIGLCRSHASFLYGGQVKADTRRLPSPFRTGRAYGTDIGQSTG